MIRFTLPSSSPSRIVPVLHRPCLDVSPTPIDRPTVHASVPNRVACVFACAVPASSPRAVRCHHASFVRRASLAAVNCLPVFPFRRLPVANCPSYVRQLPVNCSSSSPCPCSLVVRLDAVTARPCPTISISFCFSANDSGRKRMLTTPRRTQTEGMGARAKGFERRGL